MTFQALVKSVKNHKDSINKDEYWGILITVHVL